MLDDFLIVSPRKMADSDEDTLLRKGQKALYSTAY